MTICVTICKENIHLNIGTVAKYLHSTDVRSYMYRYLGGYFECHLWLAERCAEEGWVEILAPQTRFTTCKHDRMVSYMCSEGPPEIRNLPFSQPELKLVFTEYLDEYHFGSVYETLVCYHSNECYWAVLSCGTVYLVGSNLLIYGWNPSVLPFCHTNYYFLHFVLI